MPRTAASSSRRCRSSLDAPQRERARHLVTDALSATLGRALWVAALLSLLSALVTAVSIPAAPAGPRAPPSAAGG